MLKNRGLINLPGGPPVPGGPTVLIDDGNRTSITMEFSQSVDVLVDNTDVSPSLADNDDLHPDFSDTTTNFPYPLIEDSFFSTFPEGEVPGASRTDVASIIDDPSTEDTLKTVCV